MQVGLAHHKARNLTGQKFGMLTALEVSHSAQGLYWRYRCECGTVCVKCAADVNKALRKGGMPNCGCRTRELMSTSKRRHGMSGTTIWIAWCNMRARCNNPNAQAYDNYGGRGITVCARWNKFENFLEDMAATHLPGLDLERVNNEKGYTPGNTVWATRRANSMNKRNTIREVDLAMLSKQTGIGYTTLLNRLKSGWPLDALARKPSFRNRCLTLSTADRNKGS